VVLKYKETNNYRPNIGKDERKLSSFLFSGDLTDT
jgi:hypothetical protein